MMAATPNMTYFERVKSFFGLGFMVFLQKFMLGPIEAVASKHLDTDYRTMVSELRPSNGQVVALGAPCEQLLPFR